jgi:eukaryotic-like serine/threonine-protein kinase
VHTAVKPENVLFDQRGNSLLSDFGTARLVEAPQPAKGERAPRVSVDLGDSAYRAPEVGFAGSFDAASDAYSFGVLLYEMLTGSVPGRRSPVPSLVRPEVPREIDDLIDALLDDDASRRPAMGTVAAKLALSMGSYPLYLL